MPIGFQVTNDSGVLQIDGQYRNLAFIGKGTVFTTNGLIAITLYDTIAPIIFLRPLPFALYNVVKNGNATTYYYVAGYSHVAGDTIEWYAFDLFGGPGTRTNFGMEVFDPLGNVVFTSNQRPLNIKYTWQPPGPSGYNPYGPNWPYQQADGPYGEIGLPGGSRWASAISTQRFGIGLASTWSIACLEAMGIDDANPNQFLFKFIPVGSLVSGSNPGNTGVEILADGSYVPTFLFIDTNEYP